MPQQRRTARPSIAALMFIGLSLALLFAGPDEPAPQGQAAKPQAITQTNTQANSPAQTLKITPASHLTHRRFAASLRGSDVDGALVIDSEGHFIPSSSALELFDYFLAASGEQSDEQIRRRIIAEIEHRLSPEAAFDATLLLDTYLDFRDALRDMAQNSEAPAGLAQRWQTIRQLRREYFGEEEAAVLFGTSEQVITVDLERRRIHLDTSLSSENKFLQLQALSEALPTAIRAARQRANAPARNHAAVIALRQQGADNEEIFALRASDFGDAAAQRLATLDKQQDEWRQRLVDYHTARDELLNKPNSAFASATALATLRSLHFNDEYERRRVRALDKAPP